MRRFITILLSTFLLMTSVLVPGTAFAQSVSNPYHLETVKALGILDGFSSYEADSTAISRGEFAAVLMRILAMTAENETQTFPDVIDSHPYFSQISLVNKMGIMIGDESGNFCPDSNVTYVQAVKCLLHIMGYTGMAEQLGGYPSGYYLQAQKMKLFDGVSYQTNETISRAALAQLIYNALDVELFGIISMGDNIAYSKLDNATILSQYLKVRKYEALFHAMDGRSILNRQEDGFEGTVKIGNTLLYYSDPSLVDYLGYRMETYVTETEEEIEVLLYAFPTARNRELMLTVNDLLVNHSDFSLTNFVYQTKNEKEDDVKITAEHRFIYNGVYDYDFDLSDLNFTTGYVKLVDNNDDSEYDVVFVWSYENYVVESSSDEMVRCKYSKNLRRDDDATYRVLAADGVWGGWSQLNTLSLWDILSVAVSKDKKLVTVYASRGGISGTVDAISQVDGRTEITIGNQSYYVSPQYLSQPVTNDYVAIEPGLTSEFYFDVVGEIAAVYQASANSGAYGFLMGVQKVSGLSDEYKFQLLTPKGKVEVYTTDGKVVFSSATDYKASKKPYQVADILAPGGVVEYQMVKFTTNDKGILTHLEKSVDATAQGYDLGKFSMDFCVNTAASDNEKYRLQDATNTFGDYATYRKQFHLSNETMIVYAPRINGVLSKDKVYLVDPEYFSNGQRIDNFKVYDCSDTYVPAAMLYSPDSSGSTQQLYTSNHFIVVTDVYTGVNDKDEIKPMIRGMQQGREQVFEYVYDTNWANPVAPEEGSIIVCQKNLEEQLVIGANTTLYSPTRTTSFYHKKDSSGAVSTEALLEVWAQFGRLCRKNGNTMTIYDDPSSTRPTPNYLHSGSGYSIYKIKGNKVTQASEADLIPSTSNPTPMMDGTLMLCNNRYQYVTEIFIIEE